MKKLAILLAAGAGLLTFKTANAQIGLHVSLNFGPVATRVVVPAPVRVLQTDYYDNTDDYYYLPDVEAYYSVPQHCYYYNDGARWVSAAYLPGRYHDFDWRSARHYEVRAARPYMHHDEYRNRFGGFDQPGGRFDNQYANRGGFDRDRGGFDNRGGFGNNRNDNRGWNGDNRGGQYNAPNRGNYGQPQNNNGGQYQNNGQQGRGDYGQPANNNNSNGGQQGQGRGNYDGQPNQNNGQDRGGNRNDERFAATKIGVTRPSRF